MRIVRRAIRRDADGRSGHPWVSTWMPMRRSYRRRWTAAAPPRRSKNSRRCLENRAYYSPLNVTPRQRFRRRAAAGHWSRTPAGSYYYAMQIGPTRDTESTSLYGYLRLWCVTGVCLNTRRPGKVCDPIRLSMWITAGLSFCPYRYLIT